MEKEKQVPPYFDAGRDYTIKGEQIQKISLLTHSLGKNGESIRDILRQVVYPDKVESVQVKVELGGKAICGMENRPDTCLACTELPNCVLDLFYETLAAARKMPERKEGKASPKKEAAPIIKGS